MRITLIFPFYSRKTKGVIFQSKRGKYPPLGLAQVASSLEASGHEVRIIDAEAEDLDLPDVIERLRRQKPNLVGLGATDMTFRIVKSYAAAIRENFPHTPIIVGGPQVAAHPVGTLEHPEFDYAVMGEGEITASELVNTLEEGSDPGLVKGILYRKNGEIVQTEPRELLMNLDRLPSPAWHLLPMRRYQDILAIRKGYATLFTSRGCPYRCTFCDPTARLGRKFRSQSPERIMLEVKTLYENYGIREINFYDDTFTFDKERISDLCEMLIGEKMGLIWECRTRVNNVDRDLLQKMARAGCYRIRYGVESGDERILKVIKKGIRLDQAREAFRHTKEAGIDTVAYFMLGLPEETEETLKRTIDFAVELNPTYVLFSKTVLNIARSEMFQWAVQQGYIEGDYWTRYIKGEDLNSFPYLSTEQVSEETLGRYMKRAYKRFYLRPGFAWQVMKNICRSPSKISTYLRLSGEMLSHVM